MKRRITCILACVLVIATIIPSMALAASNAAILDKLTLSGVKTYDVALPTKGTKKTEKQINELLKKIPNKPSGKGNTRYLYYLFFLRMNSKKPGNYDLAVVGKEWYKDIVKTKKSFYYYEEMDLMNTKAGITCIISNTDKKNGNQYYWIKGKKTGEHNTFIFNSNNNDTMKYLNYKLYPDAIVLGEKCMVYGYESKGGTDETETFTYYSFISRSTGQLIKSIATEKYEIYTWIAFEHKLVDKADSFFDPPKDVKFTTN